MTISSEIKAGLIGALAGLIVPVISGSIWLGRLDNRVEQLEQGTWLTEMQTKLHEELRQSVGTDLTTSLRPEAVPTATGPAGTFDEPTAGSTVDVRMIARGTIAGLKPDSSLWVFVFSLSASRFFPAERETDLQANGRWASAIQIGGNYDHGQSFDLIIAEVDANAASSIGNYRKRSRLDGMERLPAGSRGLDRISVRRKPQ